MFRFSLSTLNRYFCKNFFFWFFISLTAILCIVSLFEGIELLRRSVSRPGTPLWLITEMVLLKLPTHLNTLLPFISFFATLISLWRLNQNHEILAARAAGLSIWQLVLGLSSAVTLLYAVYLLVINPIGSAMIGRYSQLEQIYFSTPSHSLSVFANGLWLRETDGHKKTIIHAQTFDLKTNKFFKITFYDFDNKGQFIGRYDAEQGHLEPGQWQLKDVYYWENQTQQDQFNIHLSRPSELSLHKIEENYAAPETLSFWQISDFVKMLEKTGLSSLKYRLYWHKQVAKIGLMIAMSFLAVLFCLQPTRYRNTSYLLGSGILCGFMIYFSSDIIYALGLAEKIPMVLSVWMIPLVTVMISMTFLLHFENPS